MSELETQPHDGPTLVHVINKTILVIVDIQNAITKYQGDFLVNVVPAAAKHLVSELRT